MNSYAEYLNQNEKLMPKRFDEPYSGAGERPCLIGLAQAEACAKECFYKILVTQPQKVQ